MTTTEHRQAAQIEAWLDEVTLAFFAVSNMDAPNTGETPGDLHQRLLITRAAMTRVGELAGQMTLLGGRVKSAMIERRGAQQDAEAKIMSEPKGGRRVTFTEDFASGQERNARLAAGTVAERSALRRVERLSAELDAALTYTRDRHRELDRAVRDVETRLRLLTFEDRLS